MKVLINGEKVDNVVRDDDTLAEVLQNIESGHVGDAEVIARISIDGEALTAERLSIWKDRSVDDFDETSVEIRSRSEFVGEALTLIGERLQASSKQRNDICELLSQGKIREATEELMRYLQVWSAVQQNLAIAARLMNTDLESLEIYEQSSDQQVKVTSIAEIIQQLSSQLEEIKSALEAGDFILLGDILDYEFPQLTDTWCGMLRQIAEQFNPTG